MVIATPFQPIAEKHCIDSKQQVELAKSLPKGKKQMPLRYTFIYTAALLLTVTPATSMAEVSSEAEARRLINALGCKGCHSLEGDGGNLAPALDQIGSRMSRDQISQHMAAHSREEQKGFMPSYNTTPSTELKLISDFLYHLK